MITDIKQTISDKTTLSDSKGYTVTFADSIQTLANQIAERRKHVATEEAAKQALILPFLAVLGFDIYNPAELVPEYKAGWAKVTEKIDYAIQLHGHPVLFIEAKGIGENQDAFAGV
ncbi:MAG: hypothetical protein H7Y38_16765, partial [Armatimonadetes bacterium]|nr:hypothetical protein [Armatimonadota bacterium]